MIRIFSVLYKRRKFNDLYLLNFSHLKKMQCDSELLFIKYLLKNKDDIFFDVGANTGEYTFQAERILKQKHIFSFEPNPKLYSALKHLLKIQIYTH
jgi:predicted RNA methylase